MGKGKGKKKKVDLSKIKIPPWAKKDKLIWVEMRDKDDIMPVNYYEAVVIKTDEKTKKVKVDYPTKNKGPAEVWGDRIAERCEVAQAIEDLVDIDPLNDAELLRCLQTRYENDDIACFCGPTLIATNPYKGIKKAALQEDKLMFRRYALGEGVKPITKPHIWNTAARTFRQIFDNDKKQAVCISGESGAGKTFLTKMVMAFITSIFESEKKEGDKKEDDVPVEDKILGCNPVLESFGNSKTVRNDNSSRFGKYFIMFVDREDKHIYGAQIKNYLLEKSRIITQAKTERNYHVFYGILRFMPQERLKQYGYNNNGDKTDMEKFDYLRKSECFIVPKVDDKEFYDDTCDSFKNLGFNEEERHAIFKIIACVLNLGNVPIDTKQYVEGSVPCRLENNGYLKRTMANLGLGYDELCDGCSLVVRVIAGETSKSPRSPNQTEAIRDALAKDLYNNCFNWIVRKLNLTLLPENYEQYTSVGLLDIFGFEDFDVNSIEQFCINYTNEKLQNLYISYVFKAEMVIFEEEGLHEFLELITYSDNQDIMDLMDKKPYGIFHLIDSVGKVAKDDGKDDDKLISQIMRNHEKNPLFFKNRLKPELFGLKHTAKDVFYYIIGFVEKNKDELPKNLVNTLHNGDKEIMKIFDLKLTHDEVLEEKKADPREKFLGYKFRVEMQSLMDELLSCECNFVRAIKPNEQKKKDFWVPELALCQIKYLGILDSINVRRDSLPVRRKFDIFYEKYQDLDEISNERMTSYLKLKEQGPDWKQLCLNIIESLEQKKPEEILTGSTRIFMSVDFQNYMLECLNEKQKVKREALEKIIQGFKAYDFADNWNVYRIKTAKVIIMAKDLLNTWSSKIEAMKFKKFLYFVKKGQNNYRVMKRKQEIRKQKDSAIVIGRAYELYKIRQILFNAKRIIVSLSKCAKKMMFRAFMARVRINKRIVNDIFELAWIDIETKLKGEAVKAVQRIWRGYKSRLGSKKEVEKLELIKEEVKKTKAATTIQKMAKGFLVRSRMDRLHRAASFIQGYTRMVWLSKYYQLLRASVRKIQRVVRKYLIKKNKIEERMISFLSKSKQYIKALRTVEHDIIFNQSDSFQALNNLENYTRVKFFEDERSFKSSIPDVKTFVPELPNIDLNPKMRLFSVLIDFDCQVDTSDVYEQSWAIDFLNFYKKIQGNNSRLLHLEIGESFTLAVNDDLKIYSWGLNDNQQLGRPIDLSKSYYGPKISKVFSSISPRVVASGDEHSLMVDYQNNLYSWGGNLSGQLGLGHSREVRSIVKLSSVGSKIKTVAAKGKMSYVITGDGNILKWPNKSLSHKFTPCYAKISEPSVKFRNISAGYGFAIALTENGLLFSFGENENGQLGLGDTYPRDDFTLISQFRIIGEKITEVSCGHKHSICKTANGKVFTWGLGADGQLGIGVKKSSTLPCHVNPYEARSRPYKAISVEAGFAGSYILYENRKVYHAGVNATTHSENVHFRKLNYEPKVFGGKLQDEFTPLKLYCKWSKALTCCYITLADFRDVKESKKVRDKITNQVNMRWAECYNQVLPPYDETTSKHVCPKYVKKMKQKSRNFAGSLIKTQSRSGRKKKSMRSSKKSAKKRKNEVESMTKKLEDLMLKPQHQWSADDRKLIKMIRDYNNN